MLGVIIARNDLRPGQYINYFFTTGLILSTIALISRWRLVVLIACLGGLLLGCARGGVELAAMHQYDDYIGDEVIVTGQISADPTSDKGSTRLTLANITIQRGDDRAELTGQIWVELGDCMEPLRRSNWIMIDGLLDEGFGSYAATMSRATLRRVIDDRRDAMGKLRDSFAGKLGKVLDQQELGLGMGLLAGQKTALGDDMQSAFVAASLTHILVASGYNLTVLVRFARRLLAGRSRLVALILSITLILLFASLTGLSASMNRAVLVSVFSLLAWYVGRKIHPVVLLSVTGAITIWLDPSQIWGDVGWYLSFGSFAGVIILAPLINDFISGRQKDDSADNDNEAVDESQLTVVARLARKLGTWPGALLQILVETFSAQLVTLPIIALFMGNISLVGMVTNIVVLPLLPLAMLLTFVAGLSVLALPNVIAKVLAVPAQVLLGFIIVVAQWGATLPGSTIEFTPTISQIIIYYGVVVIVAIVLKLVTKHNFYSDNVVE